MFPTQWQGDNACNRNRIINTSILRRKQICIIRLWWQGHEILYKKLEKKEEEKERR